MLVCSPVTHTARGTSDFHVLCMRVWITNRSWRGVKITEKERIIEREEMEKSYKLAEINTARVPDRQ